MFLRSAGDGSFAEKVHKGSGKVAEGSRTGLERSWTSSRTGPEMLEILRNVLERFQRGSRKGLGMVPRNHVFAQRLTPVPLAPDAKMI